MQNTIKLHKTSLAWIAVHIGPHEAETIRLFGTNALPTAFTPEAPAETVQRHIQGLNPDCVVTVA